MLRNNHLPSRARRTAAAGSLLGALLLGGCDAMVELPPRPTSLVPPVVTSVSPSSGYAGDVVRVAGTGFSAKEAENRVSFGTATGRILAADASGTALEVVVPRDAATAAVRVEVQGRGASGGAFKYLGRGHLDAPVVLEERLLRRGPRAIACDAAGPWIQDAYFDVLVAPDQSVRAVPPLRALWAVPGRLVGWVSEPAALRVFDGAPRTWALPATVREVALEPGGSAALLVTFEDRLAGVSLADGATAVEAPDGVAVKVAAAGDGLFVAVRFVDGACRVDAVTVGANGAPHLEGSHAFACTSSPDALGASKEGAVIAVSVDHKLLLFGLGPDGPEARDASRPSALPSGLNRSYSLGFSSDGRTLLGLQEDRIIAYDVHNGTATSSVATGPFPQHLAICPDGRAVVSVDVEGKLVVLDSRGGQVLGETVLTTPAGTLARLGDGSSFGTIVGRRAVTIDALQGGHVTGDLVDTNVSRVLGDPWAPPTPAAVGDRGFATLATPPVFRATCDAALQAVGPSHAGDAVAVATTDPDFVFSLRLLSPGSPSLLPLRLGSEDWVNAVAALGPDSLVAAVAHGSTQTLQFYAADAAGLHPVRSLDLEDAAQVLFPGRGGRVVSAVGGSPLHFWMIRVDAASGAVLGRDELPLPSLQYVGNAASPDGRRLYFPSSYDAPGFYTVEVDPTGVGPSIARGRIAATQAVNSIASTGDGARLLTALADGQIIVFGE